MTYRFRINPNARFSDGTPVTSEDVVASYDLFVDKTVEDPMNRLAFEKIERPVAESKYIVRVKSKAVNWRNFLDVSTDMLIFPAHVLKTINGDKYLKEYNFKLLPGSGPYTIRDEDIVKGRSISLRRRNDYWAVQGRSQRRASRISTNCDSAWCAMTISPSRCSRKVNSTTMSSGIRLKQWVQELNFDNVQRGLIQKKKIFNSDPQSIRNGYRFQYPTGRRSTTFAYARRSRCF